MTPDPPTTPAAERILTWNPRILKMPYVLLALLLGYAAWQQSWWPLWAIPFIYVGWIHAAPNLNLADGCLPQIVVVICVILALIQSSRFPLEIAAVCWISWLVLSLELAWRCETGRAGA